MQLTLDIETIPAQLPEVLADIQAQKAEALELALTAIQPPRHYGETAATKWWAENGQYRQQELRDQLLPDIEATYRKTSFDGAYGSVCAFGYALDDLPAQVLFGRDEPTLLHQISQALTASIPANAALATRVIGHNVVNFDLRFLMQRSMVHGIRPHTVLARAATAKPWETDKVFDTMLNWSGLGKFISLERLCGVLRVPSSKGEIDGSKVWDFVQAGRLEEIAAYCAKDVEATRACFQRMTFAVGVEALP